MAVNPAVLIDAKFAEAAQTTQYTSTGVTTIIDKFTATNNDSVARDISINVVPSGGSAGSSNLVVKTQSVDAGKTALLPEMVGQYLKGGDSISTLASVASQVVIRASGRRVT